MRINNTAGPTVNDIKAYKEYLKSILSSNTMSVTFTKVDGTERTIECTLNPTLIQADKEAIGGRHNENEETLAVYEVNLGEWRSFRVNNVLTLEIV